VLGWAPAFFWAATPHEFVAALDGYLERHGLKHSTPVSRVRLKELMQDHPDG
jgi:hypothetical protein